ncbi:MAG: FapA family protein [Desulfarculaceae bacterium]|nr:FapA family protein [Desulfarculaceae bacterium]
MSNEKPDTRNIPFLGKMALKKGLVTQKELDEAALACKDAEDPETALQDYFVSEKIISSENIKRLVMATKAFELRQKDVKFGAIAVNKGYISRNVLDLVLEEQKQQFRQKKEPRLIGDMLVDAGIISKKQRDVILKKQNRMITEIKKARKPEKQASDSEAGALEEGQKNTNNDKKSLTTEPVAFRDGMELMVSEDGMEAYVTKTDEFDDTITVDDIKDALEEYFITHGVVGDDLIKGFIQSRGFKQKGFLAAKGKAPVQGRDAVIEYFFDTDHLKAGNIDEEGNIDFKDRGEIPQVNQETVLAEKTPLKEAVNGMNIYGEEISVRQAVDVKFKYDKGAKLSEDGLKILSAVKGFPRLSWSGAVSVDEEYTVRSDVDYETGHIDYKGHINIKGCIKSGFRVTGHDIRAEEIEGGIVHAEGNLTISGGVNEARIYARGNVQANFVHKSNITCLGTVNVAKEIVDSKIKNSGSCVIKQGKIISSQISSKMGVTAGNIGTDMSGPSTIKTGRDVFIENETENIKNKIGRINESIKELKTKKSDLEAEYKKLQQEATNLAHFQDRAQLEQRDTISQITSMSNDLTKLERLKDLKAYLQKLKSEEKATETKLTGCFDRIDELEAEIEKIDGTMTKRTEQKQTLAEERKNLAEWSRANPGNTTITVLQVIQPETRVCGKHSEKRVDEKAGYVTIKELGYTDSSQAEPTYEMKIVPNS